MRLEVKNLSCLKGGSLLFRNLNFSLSEGKMILLQGQNGVGKSSLIKILAGIALPKKGAIFWDGRKINEPCSEYLNDLSYLDHKNALKKMLTPLENIQYRISLGGGESNLKQIEEILKAFDLHKVKDNITEFLSQGQKRKVALSAIILQRKKLWLLDEPFDSLDKDSIPIMENFLTLHLESKGLVVMASHNEIKIAAQQIVLLKSVLM